jgi:hypothetical protein
MDLGVPFTTTRTFCVFGDQNVLVFLLEWLTLLPDMVPFLQISQILPIPHTSSNAAKRQR